MSEQLTSMKQRQAGGPTAQVVQAKPPHQQPFLPAKGLDFLDSQACFSRAPSSYFLQEWRISQLWPTAVQAAMLQQSQALSSLLFELCGFEGGGQKGTTTVGFGCRLLPCGSASSGQAAQTSLPSAALTRRILGAGVDVPVPPEVRLRRRPGDSIHHVVLGSGAREFMALTFVALDQRVLERRWGFAWLLTLLEEPPAQLCRGREAKEATSSFQKSRRRGQSTAPW